MKMESWLQALTMARYGMLPPDAAQCDLPVSLSSLGAIGSLAFCFHHCMCDTHKTLRKSVDSWREKSVTNAAQVAALTQC